MGTSKGYDLPQGGEWKPLKNDASNFIQNLGGARVSAPQLVRSYIHAKGGPHEMARGGGGAAAKTGRKLARFISTVSSAGLNTALTEAGLGALIGRAPAEVSASLLDVLAGPASTLDEHAARHALNTIFDELLENTKPEDVEMAFSAQRDAQRLFQILTQFFGEYLYQIFCRDFYEVWIGKVGSVEAARGLDAVKDYIDSAVRSKLVGRDLSEVRWIMDEGKQAIEEVLQNVLDIFQVTT